MPRRAVQRDFTDLESEDFAVDPFAEQPKKVFTIPSSVGLTDDEEPSPSQYRVERVCEDVADPLGEDEEVPEDLIDSDEDDFDHTDPSPAKTRSPKVPSAVAVYS